MIITMPIFKLSPLAFLILTSAAYAKDNPALVRNEHTSVVMEKKIPEDILFEEKSLADAASFDPIFLNVDLTRKVDLSRFNQGAAVLPGQYQAEVYVNNELLTQAVLQFVERDDKSVQPCIPLTVVAKINLDTSQLPTDIVSHTVENCIFFPDWLPQSGVDFDSGNQRLDITIPQALMLNSARGYINPALWDRGVPAAFLGYQLNGYAAQTHGHSRYSSYAGLNAGVNIGAWYFRHDGSYNWQQDIGGQYQKINTYMQRDIPAIKGRVVLGESNTTGRVFNSLPYRGVELVSDERMLPQSLRGYAPDIRGIARTNAKVTVRQNHLVIYEISVPPGEFTINDLYPSGYGGNLDITVTEADGSKQNYQVPYASVTQLLRPGAHHYDFIVGELNDVVLTSRPKLYQATYQRGLTNLFTGYSGMQVNENYNALMLGTAISTPIGALSADITQARANLQDTSGGAISGQSYQLGYSKYLRETNSNLTIAAYRFSTSGYLDFMTAMRIRDAQDNEGHTSNIWRPKQRFNITATQGLPEHWGQLYVSGFTQNYWNNDRSDLQYQLGYSNSYDTQINTINYSLRASRVRSTHGQMENNILLSLGVPLGKSSRKYVPQFNASLSRDSEGRNGEQVGISGTAGEDYQYSYGMTASRYNQSADTSLAVNGQYRTPFTMMGATYGTGKHYQNTSIGLNGTVLAYQKGVIMTPYTGDTFAIVEAKGATGAKISSYPGLRIDPWGHAAVPYLSPYEMNDVSLDPKGLPYDLELQTTRHMVAPYSGAVVHLKYDTKHGYPLLITASRSDGESLPFGADVFDIQGNSVGAVGQMSQIYARVQQQQGSLTIKWGGEPNQQCFVSYLIPQQPKNGKVDALTRVHSVCEKGNTNEE
jgi:outer membrane usher protein